MAFPVVEFSREEYKIRKVFGQKLMSSKKNIYLMNWHGDKLSKFAIPTEED